MSEPARKISPQQSIAQARSLLKHAVSTEPGRDEPLVAGASCLAVCAGEVFFQEAFGTKCQVSLQSEQDSGLSSEAKGKSNAHEEETVDINSVFDVGSLTGSLVTALLAFRLVADGRLRFEDRVSRHLQNFGVLGKAEITIAHLLTHTSGLPQHYSFQRDLPDLSRDAIVGAKTFRGSRDALFNAVNRMSLRAEPGLRHQWSEVGLLVLGLVVETITGTPLGELAEKQLFRPLRLRSTNFLSLEKMSKMKLSADISKIASSGRCPMRGSEVRGEPFDFVARALGGVAGHAGLFSSALDLGVFGMEILKCLSSNRGLVPPQLAQYFMYAEGEDRIAYNYGWEDLASQPDLSRSQFSKKAFGRASSLGSALWLDPDLDLVICLTANRKNPTEPQRRFEQFRAELASTLVDTIRAL